MAEILCLFDGIGALRQNTLQSPMLYLVFNDEYREYSSCPIWR